MLHYRTGCRLIFAMVVVGPIAPISSVALTVAGFEGGVSIGLGIAGFATALSLLGFVYIWRAKSAAGAYNGLSRSETRSLDISSPQAFDRTMGIILRRRDPACVLPSEANVSQLPRRPMSRFSLYGALGTLAIPLYPVVGFLTFAVCVAGEIECRRRIRSGRALAVIGEGISIAGMAYWVLTRIVPLLK